MPKYSDNTLHLMKSIISAAGEGKTFELPTHKSAVNMRQRIYNYRNANPDDEEAKTVTVTVKDNLVLVASKPADYMDSVSDQLKEEN